jgi:hypothetical protein
MGVHTFTLMTWKWRPISDSSRQQFSNIVWTLSLWHYALNHSRCSSHSGYKKPCLCLNNISDRISYETQNTHWSYKKEDYKMLQRLGDKLISISCHRKFQEYLTIHNIIQCQRFYQCLDICCDIKDFLIAF